MDDIYFKNSNFFELLATLIEVSFVIIVLLVKSPITIIENSSWLEDFFTVSNYYRSTSFEEKKVLYSEMACNGSRV